MPRIEIELTSARPDGTWTWRAAGARQPKGTLDASVLPGGAKVGDVLRAEADIDIDGITVRSTAPVTQKKGAVERIEILGSGREEPPVTTNMRGGVEAGGERERGRRGDRDHDRGRGDRDRGGRAGSGGPGGASRPPRPGGGTGGRPSDRVDRPRPDGRPPDGARPADAAARPPRGDRPGRDRPSGDRPPASRPAGERTGPARPAGDRPPRAAGDRPPRDRPPRPERPARPAETPARPKAKKLQPARVYRDAVLAELSPERKAVAGQLLRGGIPAVRQAVEEQNAKAREVGGPEIKADALLAVAEELLPALRAAEWRDRAEAAVAIVDEISVRDLRAVVSGSDTARDEEGRALAARLRDALDRRAAAERQTWIDEITASLDDGRVVRALRISGRPPEPGVRFPADLAKRLSDAGGDALGPDTTPDRWAAVLEAVAASPVRRTITPRGLPSEPGEALIKALRLASPRVPAIATLLGESPASPPRRPPRPPAPGGRPAPGRLPGRPPGRPVPPPPPPPAAAAVAVTEAPRPADVATDSTPAEPDAPAVEPAEPQPQPAPAEPDVPEAVAVDPGMAAVEQQATTVAADDPAAEVAVAPPDDLADPPTAAETTVERPEAAQTTVERAEPAEPAETPAEPSAAAEPHPASVAVPAGDALGDEPDRPADPT